MLISDVVRIGERMRAIRKEQRLTQAQAAELAGIADRTYADIERGTVDMRVGTLLALCTAFGITPNDLLWEDNADKSAIKGLERLSKCSPKHRDGAEQILLAYLDAIE